MDQVDILIPTYNRAELLKLSLEALTHQTHKNIQVIIYDDASTDNTEDVVAEYHTKLAMTYVKGEENVGVGKARNALIKLSTAKFFAFQDSDDISHADRIEAQLREIQRTGTDICFTAAYFFKHPNMNRKYEHQIDVTKYVDREGLANNMAFATAMVRAESVKGVHFRGRVKEDVVWLTTLITKKRTFSYVPEPLYYIRRHEGRLTVTGR